MTARNSSLPTVVSFLETMLRAVGQEREAAAPSMTRDSLRERFRKVVRLVKRLQAEQDADRSFPSMLAPSSRPTLNRANWVPQDRLFYERPSSRSDTCFARTARSGDGDSWCGSRMNRPPVTLYIHSTTFDGLPVLVPFVPKAHVTTLNVAMRIGIDGITEVYAALVDFWLRRHDLAKSSTASKQPQRWRALDRLLVALMRFVFGFFGSHKVDARNNP